METLQRELPPSLFSPRDGSNEWLHHPRVISALRDGDQLRVPPITMEFASILSCDAGCPACPYNRARSALGGDGRVDDFAPSDDRHAASWATTKRVLDAAHEEGVTGVLVTGGGEPLQWEHLTDALVYAGKLGMRTCLYTNGLRLGAEETLASTLWQPENRVSFIRVSVNAITQSTVRRHWGAGFDIDQQLHGLFLLLRARTAWVETYQHLGKPLPSLQISTIMDRHNVADLPKLLGTIAEIFAESGSCRGPEDVMIVRPLVIHGRAGGYGSSDHGDEVIHNMIDVTRPGGRGHGALAEAGVRLFLGFGLAAVASGAVRNYRAVIDDEYAWRVRNPVNLATGIFLTVGPSGTVYSSTEHNCDDRWAIGSLLEHSVADIYASERRAEVLGMLNRAAWQASVAQPFSRTNRLARIGTAIAQGTIDETNLMLLREQDSARGRHGVLLD